MVLVVPVLFSVVMVVVVGRGHLIFSDNVPSLTARRGRLTASSNAVRRRLGCHMHHRLVPPYCMPKGGLCWNRSQGVGAMQDGRTAAAPRWHRTTARRAHGGKRAQRFLSNASRVCASNVRSRACSIVAMIGFTHVGLQSAQRQEPLLLAHQHVQSLLLKRRSG